MSRPFKGLSLRDGPESTYDAVIVGAGIGGLVCANLLAQRGLRVLIIEQHYMVGGYCSTFRRNGFTFDAATHFYPLLGNPSSITGKLLRDLGIATEWIKMDPVDKFHFPDGSTFTVPADYDAYRAKLRDNFPAEALALDTFFSLVKKAYFRGLLRYFRNRATEDIEEYRSLTVRQVLDARFRDAKLKLLLAADCAHWGSTPSRTSFLFDSMLRLSYFLGNYYPKGGSQTFVDALALRFEEMDGHILMSSNVTRILVRQGMVYGVEVETGPVRARVLKEVSARVVISNADLVETLDHMVEPQHLPLDFREAVRKLRPTYPCFLTHIGLKDVSTEILREAHGYHWASWDAERVAECAFKIFVPTLFEPGLAPPGGHVLIVQKLTDVNYEAMDDWTAHKNNVEQYILNNLGRILPGITKKIVVKMSATALTSYRYTRNYHGAMLGWEMSPSQLGESRPGIASPLDNLYFVGHWTQPGGGVTPVIVSAMWVANKIVGSPGSTISSTALGSELSTFVASDNLGPVIATRD